MFFSSCPGVGRGVLEGAKVGVGIDVLVFWGGGIGELEGVLAGSNMQPENRNPAAVRTTSKNLIDFITTFGLSSRHHPGCVFRWVMVVYDEIACAGEKLPADSLAGS